jgi:hypothetical protein
VEGAIVKMFRVSPILRCNGLGQLTEIWLCVSKNLVLIECPEGTKAAFSGRGIGEDEGEGEGNDDNKCDTQISIPLLPDRNRRDPHPDPDCDGNGEGGHQNRWILVAVLLAVLGCLIVGGLAVFSWQFYGRSAVKGISKPMATSQNEFQLINCRLLASDQRSGAV